MNTIQLECFMSVADHLNFARAAEELHISQPAVTHQIASLEAELGTKLFRRTTRSVALTNDGRGFFSDARQILESMRLAKQRLSPQAGERFSTLTIGCHTTFELWFLPQLLQSLLHKHPGLHPILKVTPFHSLESQLDNGSVDLIFQYKAAAADAHLWKYHELTKFQMDCVMPKNHPLADESIITDEILKSEKLILMDPHRIPPELVELQMPFVQAHTSNDLYFCDTYESALMFVEAGIGITLLPELSNLQHCAVKRVPIAHSPLFSYGIYYQQKEQTPPLRDLLKAADSYFSE